MLTLSKIAPILSTDSAGWVWLNSDDDVTLCAYRWFPEIAEQRALMVSENNREQGFWVSVHLYRVNYGSAFLQTSAGFYLSRDRSRLFS